MDENTTMVTEATEEVTQDTPTEAPKEEAKKIPKQPQPSDKTVIKNLRRDLRLKQEELDKALNDLNIQEDKNQILFQEHKKLQAKYNNLEQKIADDKRLLIDGINFTLSAFMK